MFQFLLTNIAHYDLMMWTFGLSLFSSCVAGYWLATKLYERFLE